MLNEYVLEEPKNKQGYIAPPVRDEILEDEAEIAARYSRNVATATPPVYEFTNDKGLLYQYYQLREIMYRKVFNTDKFVGKQDVHDKLSHILIARRDKLCIGGARITVRESDEDFPLPMESKDFVLKNIPQVAEYCKYRHCEISRFAILSDKFEKEVMHTMVKELIAQMAALGVNYLLVKADAVMVRNWRKMANIFGLTDNEIFSTVEVPENPIHPEVKWYLLRITVVPPVSKHHKEVLEYITTAQ